MKAKDVMTRNVVSIAPDATVLQAARLMLPHGKGTILFTGATASMRGGIGYAAFASAKFGLRGLHEVLSEEVRGTGVRATLVEPAATDTALWDAVDPEHNPGLPPRTAMLRPADVARAAAFALAQPEGVEIPLLSIRSGR